MIDCPRFGKWFRGCRFEPRFDDVKQRRELGMLSDYWWEHVKVDGKTLLQMKPSIPTDKRTYVRDVCTRCGKTQERQR